MNAKTPLGRSAALTLAALSSGRPLSLLGMSGAGKDAWVHTWAARTRTPVVYMVAPEVSE